MRACARIALVSMAVGGVRADQAGGLTGRNVKHLLTPW